MLQLAQYDFVTIVMWTRSMLTECVDLTFDFSQGNNLKS